MMSTVKEDLVNIGLKAIGSTTTALNSGSSGSLAASSFSNSSVNTLLKKQYLKTEKPTNKDEIASTHTAKQSSVKAVMSSQSGNLLINQKQNENIWKRNQDQTKTNEKFIVKSIHAVEPPVKSNLKTKIHPVFGHSMIRKMTLEKGEFPVIYIGSPCANNDISKSDVETKVIPSSSPSIPTKITSKSSSVLLNKKTITITTSTSPLPPLSSLLTQTQSKIISTCDVPMTGSVYDTFNGSANSEYDLEKAMNGFVDDAKSIQSTKSEAVKIKIDEFSPTMIPSRNKIVPNFPTVTHYVRNEMDLFQKSSFNAVPLTQLTYKIQRPNVYRQIVPKPAIEALTVKVTTPVKPIWSTNTKSVTLNSTSVVTNSTNTVVPSATNAQSTLLSSTVISTTKNVTQPGKLLLSPASTSKPKTFHFIPSTLPTKIISIPSSTSVTPSVTKYPVITVTNLKSSISNSAVQPTIAVKRKHDEKTEGPSTKFLIKTSKGITISTPVTPKLKETIPITSTIPLNKLHIKPTFKYTTDVSSTFAKKPGALVKFEDGLQMWVNNLKEMTYEDDEPVKSWDLKPGAKVVVKYIDGLFYDAEVISSYGGKPTAIDSKKPTVTAQHSINTINTATISSKKSLGDLSENAKKVDSNKNEEKSKQLGKHVLKIKCPNCFLMFSNVMLFRKHQKTVCGCSGITVASDLNMPSALIEVDESAVPPLVENYNKENDDIVKLIPRTSDGKRWFRRGTSILHRWQTTEGGSKWYRGKILRLLDSQKGQQTEFEVEYLDEDHGSGPYVVSLYEDYPHDIRIVTR